MKQTATNQFQDGLNKDLHPIVTPNSVLTDNLNGTFITYNGNEFCLQNDRGNTLKATLSEGFVPIGIKEHNGVLYIVSYKEKTKEGEIGTYPGVDWDNPDKKGTLLDEYTPLKNFERYQLSYTIYKGDDFVCDDFDKFYQIVKRYYAWNKSSIHAFLNPENHGPLTFLENYPAYLNTLHDLQVYYNVVDGDPIEWRYLPKIRAEFRTADLNFDLEHPVSIEIQDSYDGSVNLILTDNKNKPRLVNSGFSVVGDSYKIIERDQTSSTNIYSSVEELNLVQTTNILTNIDLVSVLQGGQLKGGNYTFYIKFGDADYNQTDIVAESGIISIFNGTDGQPNTISGTLADERTDKMIQLKITGLNTAYSKIYVYYSREYSDTQGFRMTEVCGLTEPVDIAPYITITGFEEITSYSAEDLNIDYHTIDYNKTAAQQSDMLFLGNVGSADTQALYSKLKDHALNNITVELTQANAGVGATSYDFTNVDTPNKSEYYSTQNIYNYIGYWPEEYYRFGVVYILKDGSTTPVFNILGKEFITPTIAHNENNFGVFKTCKASILKDDNIHPLGFRFTIRALDDDEVIGAFIVRQKRIPITICQGLSIGIDKYSGLPLTYYKDYSNEGWLTEGFLAVPKERYGADVTLRYDGGSISITDGDENAIKNSFYSLGYSYLGKRVDKDSLPAGSSWHPYQDDVDTSPGDYSGRGYTTNSTDWYFKITKYISIKNIVAGSWSWDNLDTPYYIKYTEYSVDPEEAAIITQWNRRIKVGSLPEGEIYIGSEVDANNVNNSKLDSILKKYTASQEIDKFILQPLNASLCNGILSLDPSVNQSVQTRLDGSQFDIKLEYTTSFDKTSLMHKYTAPTYNDSNKSTSSAAVYVKPDTQSKMVGSYLFSNVAGNANSANSFKFTTYQNSVKLIPNTESLQKVAFMSDALMKSETNRANINLTRGLFAPYIGIANSQFVRVPSNVGIYSIRYKQEKSDDDENYSRKVREQDNSPFFTVSERFSLSEDVVKDIYRGDCYTCTVAVRMLRNFLNPDAETVDRIIAPKCWWTYYTETYLKDQNSQVDWNNINLGDLNTVSLGYWVVFKCLSSYNLGLRSIDRFHTDEIDLLGSERSFYPLNGGSVATGNKIEESYLLNDGLSATVGEKRYNVLQNLPYIKSEYNTRVMFSNKNVTDQFTNGYRVFQGASYQDYDKQYGAIIKLLPWGNNLFCVFEHGLSILPIKEKALLQTTTEQTIHIYGHGVLPDQMSIVSQDYGSKHADSIVRTPIGIYGVDADAKKIWRFSDKQGFETLSDMKIESFLNRYLSPDYVVSIGNCDIRTHYNSFKGDVIFTWYNGTKEYAICFNERQSVWTTRYDWLPIVSENKNGEFYSLQFGEDSNGNVGIYSHEIENSSPTKWYGKQHPFEFEFVVSDPIGAQKIYENLQIISNNVQPEELQFEFIGDSYFFNKARIYHTVSENGFDSERLFGNEINRRSNLYPQDPSRRTEDIQDIFNKPNIVANQENNYTPFRNASILDDRNNVPLFGKVFKTPNATEEYHLRIPQECRNIETWGRRLGNMHYKDGIWHTTIEPIIYDARLNDPHITVLTNPVLKWNSARIRDKWCKIRVRYSGEDLAVITAIKTIVNI